MEIAPVAFPMSAPSPRLRIRTLLIEDCPGAHDKLPGWLERAPGLRHLGRRDSQAALERELPVLQPDVVLLVLAQFDHRGIELLQRLRQQAAAAQIVVLAHSREVGHIFAALGAGATGYLNLSASREELLAAVAEAHAGGAPLSSDVARIVVCSFWRQSCPREGVTALSDQERAVLELLATGCLYKEIAEHLGIGINTVSTYVRRTYEKLHVRSRAQAVAKLFRHGDRPDPSHPAARGWRELQATTAGASGR